MGAFFFSFDAGLRARGFLGASALAGAAAADSTTEASSASSSPFPFDDAASSSLPSGAAAFSVRSVGFAARAGRAML